MTIMEKHEHKGLNDKNHNTDTDMFNLTSRKRKISIRTGRIKSKTQNDNVPLSKCLPLFQMEMESKLTL